MLYHNYLVSTIVILALFAFILNLPFGYMRSRSKRYSLKWFLYIHMPVPLVVIARLVLQSDYYFIPAFVTASIAGQFCGGKIGCS